MTSAQKINLLFWLDRPWDGRAFGEQLEQLKALRLEWFLLYQNTAVLTEAYRTICRGSAFASLVIASTALATRWLF